MFKRLKQLFCSHNTTKAETVYTDNTCTVKHTCTQCGFSWKNFFILKNLP